MITFLFFGLLILGLLLSTILVETENGIASAICIVAMGLVYDFWFDRGFLTNLWHYIYNNPATILFYIFGWIFLGIIWSFFRWYFFLKESKRRQDKIYANDSYKSDKPIKYQIPTADDHKSLITIWMIFWVLSIIGYVSRNPIAKLYNWIFETVTGVYNKLTASVFKV